VKVREFEKIEHDLRGHEIFTIKLKFVNITFFKDNISTAAADYGQIISFEYFRAN
jgi:hypothetical protein